jgi:hypothetical protein
MYKLFGEIFHVGIRENIIEGTEESHESLTEGDRGLPTSSI